MKKKILLAVTLGGLVPMGINAICFKYVDGPKKLNKIKVEVDATKIGAQLPTIDSSILTKGDNLYSVGRIVFTGNTVYVTVKEYNGMFSSGKTLIQGKELNAKAAYDISIDNNNQVTFTKIADVCAGSKKVGDFVHY